MFSGRQIIFPLLTSLELRNPKLSVRFGTTQTPAPGRQGSSLYLKKTKDVLCDSPPVALQAVYISCRVCFQKVGDNMRTLVLFLLAVLGCSPAQGKLVTKCELKKELIKAIGDMPERVKQRGLTVENLVAKSEWLFVTVRLD